MKIRKGLCGRLLASCALGLLASTITAYAGSASVSSVSTKFDYLPGDNVLFMDDFSQEELGEFPSRWNLAIGTFEVAEMGGERWLRCTASDGTIRMKLPAMEALPEFWTLEFDFHGTAPMASALTVRAVNARGKAAWEATFPQGNDMALRSGDIFSTTPLEGMTTPAGRHHVMFMARGQALKVYIDQQRMASVPDISVPAGLPSQLEIRLWAKTGPMITNVRFAEGAPPAKDVFESGKFVTHGIHFANGSRLTWKLTRRRESGSSATRTTSARRRAILNCRSAVRRRWRRCSHSNLARQRTVLKPKARVTPCRWPAMPHPRVAR